MCFFRSAIFCLFLRLFRIRPIPGSSAGLPPVAHAYSKSLNTVTQHLNQHQNHAHHHAQHHPNHLVAAAAAASASTLSHHHHQQQHHHSQHYSFGGELPLIAHQRSVKSCDFETTIGTPTTNSSDGCIDGGGGHQHHHMFDHFQGGIPSSHGMSITTAGDLATTNESFYQE